MFRRNENGNLISQGYDLERFYDDVFEVCKNREELEFIIEDIKNAMWHSAMETLLILGDENPYNIDI